MSKEEGIIELNGRQYRASQQCGPSCAGCDYHDIWEANLFDVDCPLGTAHKCVERQCIFKEVDPLYQDLLKVKELTERNP